MKTFAAHIREDNISWKVENWPLLSEYKQNRLMEAKQTAGKSHMKGMFGHGYGGILRESVEQF